MRRIVVKEKLDNKFLLTKEQLHHLRVTKRFSKYICLYKQDAFLCQLEEDALVIEQKLEINNEYESPVILAISAIKFKYLEWAIQKSVELGVTKFIFFKTQHTTLQNFFDLKHKQSRIQKIIEQAVEQSFRNFVPTFEIVENFEEVLKTQEVEHKFIAHISEENPQESRPPLFFPTNSLFLVGPEGGFTNQEVERAKNYSFAEVSLGKRILRSETAALFMLAKIMEQPL